jgi:hypothetical protein
VQVIWDSRVAHGNYPNRSLDRTRFVQYLTYAPALWHEPTLLHIRREAIRSSGQYSHRRALIMAFQGVTHSLGTSQDVSKRRKKLEQLRMLPQRTEADTQLLQQLESELLLIGNADGAALLEKGAFEPSSSFSNRRDYYAPMRRQAAPQQSAAAAAAAAPAAPREEIVPYFNTARLLTALGKHIAGTQRLDSFTREMR